MFLWKCLYVLGFQYILFITIFCYHLRFFVLILCISYFPSSWFSSLARQCAQLWLKTREMLDFPLGFISEPDHFVLPKEVLEAACEKVSLHMWVSQVTLLQINAKCLIPNPLMCQRKLLKKYKFPSSQKYWIEAYIAHCHRFRLSVST